MFAFTWNSLFSIYFLYEIYFTATNFEFAVGEDYESSKICVRTNINQPPVQGKSGVSGASSAVGELKGFFA